MQDPAGKNKKTYAVVGALVALGIVFVAIRGAAQDTARSATTPRTSATQAAYVPPLASAGTALDAAVGLGPGVAGGIARAARRQRGGYALSLLVNTITVNGSCQHEASG